MIPTVKVTFKTLPNFILSEKEYKEMGGFNGFCRENHIDKKLVKKVEHVLMKVEDYPLNTWEG